MAQQLAKLFIANPDPKRNHNTNPNNPNLNLNPTTYI